jgi:hypothetical protein
MIIRPQCRTRHGTCTFIFHGLQILIIHQARDCKSRATARNPLQIVNDSRDAARHVPTMRNYVINCTKWKIFHTRTARNGNFADKSMFYLLKTSTAPSLFFCLSLLSTEQPIGGTHAVDDVAIFGYGTRFAIHGYER